MPKLLTGVVAAAFALAPTVLPAAELTPEQRAEMRERANGLIAQRELNPAPQADDVKIPQRGEVKLDQNRSELKTKTATTKKPKREAKKKKRRLRDLPGALVRDRR